MAADCGHITMLQRSPTYFRAGRNAIPLAEELRALGIDETWIHEIVRKKILYEQDVFTRRSFTEPDAVKQELLGVVRAQLGDNYDVDTHFTPTIGRGGSVSPLSGRRSVSGDQQRQSLGGH